MLLNAVDMLHMLSKLVLNVSRKAKTREMSFVAVPVYCGNLLLKSSFLLASCCCSSPFAIIIILAGSHSAFMACTMVYVSEDSEDYENMQSER